ncbi:hypothetical protein Taro_049361 [Colocasia esculenta]|uniref:Uncharacterized protein n=1 Tax=Colocasia esculenta TaxID=4460 RepID=A0A843XAQ8_COLES|nr:hypothetical protein [Colocasia esculenta]
MNGTHTTHKNRRHKIGDRRSLLRLPRILCGSSVEIFTRAPCPSTKIPDRYLRGLSCSSSLAATGPSSSRTPPRSPYAGWPRRKRRRFVGEVWGMGVDIKDTCNRGVVAKAVREVMAGVRGREPGREMRAAAANMSKMVRECVEEGGSSYVSLEWLIRDIRTISSSTPRLFDHDPVDNIFHW